jgi:hypothetical protein
MIRIRRDPLEAWLKKMNAPVNDIVSSDFSRYADAYHYYFLAMGRVLQHLSIAARYRDGAHYARKYNRKYTPHERRIAEQYNASRHYLEFDMANCLIHTRILLDRVASLSRHFLQLPQLPSFHSFSDHKKFFERQTGLLPAHEEYAKYIREKTGWFEMPLKEVRDKFVVHSAPKHMAFLGFGEHNEGEWLIMLPDAQPPEKSFSKVRMITVNPLRMSYDIEQFLSWYGGYAGKLVKRGRIRVHQSK